MLIANFSNSCSRDFLTQVPCKVIDREGISMRAKKLWDSDRRDPRCEARTEGGPKVAKTARAGSKEPRPSLEQVSPFMDEYLHVFGHAMAVKHETPKVEEVKQTCSAKEQYLKLDHPHRSRAHITCEPKLVGVNFIHGSLKHLKAIQPRTGMRAKGAGDRLKQHEMNESSPLWPLKFHVISKKRNGRVAQNTTALLANSCKRD